MPAEITEDMEQGANGTYRDRGGNRLSPSYAKKRQEELTTKGTKKEGAPGASLRYFAIFARGNSVIHGELPGIQPLAFDLQPFLNS